MYKNEKKLNNCVTILVTSKGNYLSDYNEITKFKFDYFMCD